MAITASNVTTAHWNAPPQTQIQGIFPFTIAPLISRMATSLFSSSSTPAPSRERATKGQVARKPTTSSASATPKSQRRAARPSTSSSASSTSARRSARVVTQKKRYAVPSTKDIATFDHHERERVVFLDPSRALKREDSFILVDFGSHFKMVKPGYARAHFQRTPDNIVSVAGYHAFQPVDEDSERDMSRLANSLQGVPTMESRNTRVKKGIKRVRFDEDEEEEAQAPRVKRARTSVKSEI